MANSDNVLRGGLTPKHVDVAELLRVLDFTPVLDAHVATRSDGVECRSQTPAAEFAASVITLDGEHLGHEVDAPSHHDGPQILVCTQGSVTVRAKSGIGETSEVQMDRGSAAWVAADDGPIRLQASRPSALFRATVGG
jgi:mannose-6-phosphate isomerase